MNKSFTLLSAAMMCVSTASAQFSNEPVISEPSFWYTMGFIPEEYTVGQQPVLVLENYDGATDKTQYVIYNSDLQKTKVISIKNEIFKYGYDEDDIVHTYPTDIILISPKLAALDPEYITLTQTLFNTDAKYEYMMPVVSDAGADENGNYTIIGFKMLDDSGTELSRIMIPSGFESMGNKVKVIDFGTKRYLLISGYKIGSDNYEDEKVFVYSINTQASGAMQLVAELSGVAVNPRVARQSEPINVTFSTDGIASRKVIVTSVNGTVVMSKNVAQGETSVSIDTSRLSHGMYVVSVIENGKKSEHCKVVIR